VLTHDGIFEAFWSEDRTRAFLHSHSFAGNPVACAAANATLDLFESTNAIAANRGTAAKLAAAAARFADHPAVGDLRQTGMVLAFELVEERATRREYTDHPRQRALAAYRAGLDAGAVLRPLGNVLYWMPPYCIDDEAIAVLDRATAAAIEAYVRCA
jgi:adenosylmethionine-8-amino-7-oxononanoate aminotransferase